MYSWADPAATAGAVVAVVVGCCSSSSGGGLLGGESGSKDEGSKRHGSSFSIRATVLWSTLKGRGIGLR